MKPILLFADDGETAEYLLANAVDKNNLDDYVGVSLFIEPADAFKAYGIKSVFLGDYINRKEHEINGIEASNYVLNLNSILGLSVEGENSLCVNRFDPLFSFHSIIYFNLGCIFYYCTAIPKVIREFNPLKILAVDMVSQEPKISPRPRNLFVKILSNVCRQWGVDLGLFNDQENKSYEDIPRCSVKDYKYSNNISLIKMATLLETDCFSHRTLKKMARFLPVSRTISLEDCQGSVLYLGTSERYREIIKKLSSGSILQLSLDYNDSLSEYFVKRGNTIFLNLAYLTNHYISDKCKEFIENYKKRALRILNALEDEKKLGENFFFNGVDFKDVFLSNIRSLGKEELFKNVEIYKATENFAEKFKVRFSIAYDGWTRPYTYAMHEALKGKGVKTAYLSHGMNVVNKDIIAIIKGDGTMLPADILLAPGKEYLRGLVANGLKGENHNYITGYPYYKKIERLKSPIGKYVMKKKLGLDVRKKIILYPSIYMFPCLNRPNAVSYVEEFKFINNIFKELKKDKSIQFVVKSKQIFVPDKSYIKFFEANYPQALLRFGKIGDYLSIADAVINFNSSSGIEALIAGVPVIYYKPNDRKDWFEPYSSTKGEPNFFLHANSIEEIPMIFNDIVSGRLPDWYEGKMAEVEDHFMKYSGDESAQCIVDVIRKFL